jgi:hypothetical protein
MNGVTHRNIRERALAIACREAERFDAFQDNPWPMLYREMDERYPGSRFILTVRPSDRWIRSVVKHFGKTDEPMREWIYGPGCGHPCGNEDVYIERYERHNAQVAEYFRDRPADLLTLDITSGDGWELLCPFLGQEIPAVPFPCENQASIRRKPAYVAAAVGRRLRKALTSKGRRTIVPG